MLLHIFNSHKQYLASTLGNSPNIDGGTLNATVGYYMVRGLPL